MPNTIEFIRSKSADSVRLFAAGEFDILPMSTNWAGDAATRLLKDSAYHIYETLPSKVFLVSYNKSGLKDFTPQDRLYFGEKIAEASRKLRPQFGSLPTVEFFQFANEGGLDSDLLTRIQRLRKEKPEHRPARKLRFGIGAQDFLKMKELLADQHEIEVVSYATHPMFAPESDQPDVMTMTSDISSNDLMSVITANLSSNLFVPGLDGTSWLDNFVNLDSANERMLKLKELHQSAMLNGSVVPNVVAPFYAISRNGIHFEATKTQGSMNMWTIRRD